MVEGTLVVPEDDTGGEHTSLDYQLKPCRPADRQAVSRVHLDLLTQREDGRPAAQVIAWPNDHRQTPFCIPVSYSIPPPTGQSRPATNLAYQWLAGDLRAIGWLTQYGPFND